MDFHPADVERRLGPELETELAELRARRAFCAETYLENKGSVLCGYMAQGRRGCCVVAVSGGIDSAVVLGICARAGAMRDSPIRQVVAICLPVSGMAGATGQNEATERGIAVAQHFGVRADVVELGAAMESLQTAVEGGVEIAGSGWAPGQLVSYMRTPALYYTTSLLVQEGLGPIVCGTTNLDEGGYLGYFGKASDGMVDVQLISDLHKSEVYALGEFLGVPEAVLGVAPSGDMFDGRVDEEVFGTDYDFVEMYLELLMSGRVDRSGRTRRVVDRDSSWSEETKAQFAGLADNLEGLHDYNGHKYLGHSPAVHLDVRDVSFAGSWQYGVWPAREGDQ